MTSPAYKKILPATAAALCLLTAVAAWYCYGGEKKPVYLTGAVERGNIETSVLATGTIEADNLVSVGAQVSGQLKSIKVKLGDTVKAGQTVAEIDSLPQQNTLRTRTAALAAVLAEKQAKEASLHQAELTYKRQTQMLQGDATARESFESAEASLKVAKAEIGILDAQIQQAKIAVDTAQLDLGYTKITSPIDGVVVAVVTKEGQTVNASQSAPTIIKVADLSRMTIKVEISEADVVRVHAGQRVSFTILGEPELRYSAELASIEPAPESISTESTTTSTSTSSSSSSSTAVYYMGVLHVPNVDGKLRISMTAQVHIILAEAKNALIIPAAALNHKDGDGRYAVKVITEQEQIETHWLHIGQNDNVQAEVLDGLKEGQRVVIGEQTTAATTVTTNRQRQGPPPGMF